MFQIYIYVVPLLSKIPRSVTVQDGSVCKLNHIFNFLNKSGINMILHGWAVDEADTMKEIRVAHKINNVQVANHLQTRNGVRVI